MDLSSLTLLVEIIDAGNLSQAARKLRMTRANVSYHLSQLEKDAGVQLVRRTTRRVEPTEWAGGCTSMAGACKARCRRRARPWPPSARACRAAWA